MRKNQSITGLVELGLSEKEAQFYHAALKNGPTTAQVLALDSGLKRSTVYSCIESLAAKGLLHIEIDGKRKLFIAEPPEKLVSLLERKKQILNNLMPQLVQDYIHSSPPNNSIKIYHGLAGIKVVYDGILTTLKEKDDYLVISDQQKWYALDPDYFDEFIQKRALLKPTIKLILQNTEHAKKFQCKQQYYHEQIKLLPKNIDLNINMVIFGNKILITQIVEPLLAMIIENKNVAAMNKILFNIIRELLSD